ncbi:hypothetical protein [Coraliomargarita parva]|uniref:hypothetical protein n=1 Tax=Coraliomargarita parva TaxID=3014050 RepID=UPI0022B3F691|nr:hypothetical protein [Coraliomargarita parva]
MTELYIRKVAVWEPGEDAEASLAGLREAIGRRVARRMTHLGMMLSEVLKEMPISEDSSVVYATRFAETCAIERFLDSFPYPSPQMFQTSIHPSGVEQYLIQQKQPVRELFPLANGQNLLLRALNSTALCQGANWILCGGEERGSWLRDLAISSDYNYAWALELSPEPEARIGSIRWQALEESIADDAIYPEFVQALQSRSSKRFRFEAGQVELDWCD